jgi:hypothetical protein
VTFDATALFHAVESHAMTLGIFPGGVNIHESAAPPEKPACSFWLGPGAPYQQGSGLASTAARVTILARIFSSRMQRPLDGIDPAVLNSTFTLVGEYNASFTLGGLIRNVDVMSVRWTPGYLEYAGGQGWRVVEVTLPVIINDLWTQGA